MNSQVLLEQLGVYFRPQFLSPEECGRLIELIDSKDSVAGGIYDDDHGSRVDPRTRRVSEIPASSEEFRWIVDRFEQLRGELGDHFGMEIAKREGPAFLRYEIGDFFLPHRDSDEFLETSARKITAVLYLNAESEGAGAEGYEGAALTLFGLMSFPGAENHGFPVASAPGLLVAFTSDTRHGVSELIRGRRYCAVCWYR